MSIWDNLNQKSKVFYVYIENLFQIKKYKNILKNMFPQLFRSRPSDFAFLKVIGKGSFGKVCLFNKFLVFD